MLWFVLRATVDYKMLIHLEDPQFRKECHHIQMLIKNNTIDCYLKIKASIKIASINIIFCLPFKILIKIVHRAKMNHIPSAGDFKTDTGSNGNA